VAGWGNCAETEARDRGGVGVRTQLEGAEDLCRQGGLVAEPEDEDARLHLFCREQAEAAGLPPEFHLCGSSGLESNVGQSTRKPGVACLIKGGKPVVKEVAGGSVGNEAQLVAEAGKTNKDGGVNGADVVSRTSRDRSFRGIADDDGVDLVGVVFGDEMYMSGVTQGIQDQGKSSDGGNDGKQDGSGGERLAGGDVEGGAGERGVLRARVIVGLLRGEPGWRRSGGVGHTDSVDALPKSGAVLIALLIVILSAAVPLRSATQIDPSETHFLYY
jgi:hypothetical protein